MNISGSPWARWRGRCRRTGCVSRSNARRPRPISCSGRSGSWWVRCRLRSGRSLPKGAAGSAWLCASGAGLPRMCVLWGRCRRRRWKCYGTCGFGGFLGCCYMGGSRLMIRAWVFSGAPRSTACCMGARTCRWLLGFGVSSRSGSVLSCMTLRCLASESTSWSAGQPTCKMERIPSPKARSWNSGDWRYRLT